MASPQYKRILLKLSGEALAGSKGFGVDPSITAAIAADLKPVVDAGVQVAVVIGGGNYFRGLSGASKGVSRTVGDTIGMLATVMNSLQVREAFRAAGIDAIVMNAIDIREAGEYYVPENAVRHLEAGRVVIIGAGTGNPFFTTDTAAALRAAETGCDVLLKATKVDGIYTADPVKDPSATKIVKLTHSEALSRGLEVMDSTAFSLCMDNSIPIIVFKLLETGNLNRVVTGEPVGSLVAKG